MSSFRRVLRQSVVAEGDAPPSAAPGQAARVLRSPTVSDVHTEMPSITVSDPTEEAFRLGVQEGREAAREQIMSASNALQAAFEASRAQLRQEFDAQRDELVALAVDIATLVMGHDQHDGGEALRDRLNQALEDLDDEDLIISVNSADLSLASDLAGPGIRVVADASLLPGEARIAGLWGQADLTRAAARRILKAELS